MKKLFFLLSVVVFFGSCYNDKYDKLYPAIVTTTCDTSAIGYTADIKPIIVAKCYGARNGCHDAVGAMQSGFDFETSLTPLQDAAANGQLLDDITWAANPMPKNEPKLTDCEINKIARWVHEGAKNN